MSNNQIPTISFRFEKDLIRACELALQNKLYVKGWVLKYSLVGIRDNPENRKGAAIAMAYEGDTPIGLAVAHFRSIASFVKPKYRRKGIGSELVKVLQKNMKETDFNNLEAGLGIEGSHEFWQQNAIPYFVIGPDNQGYAVQE